MEKYNVENIYETNISNLSFLKLKTRVFIFNLNQDNYMLENMISLSEVNLKNFKKDHNGKFLEIKKAYEEVNFQLNKKWNLAFELKHYLKECRLCPDVLRFRKLIKCNDCVRLKLCPNCDKSNVYTQTSKNCICNLNLMQR